MKQKYNILPQMFDVKPVDHAGDVDLDKIQSIKKTIFLKKTGKKPDAKARCQGGAGQSRYHGDTGQMPVPRPESLCSRAIDFKARSVQFNRAWPKKEQEVPHLIKSSYVPNDAVVPYADVIPRGEALPARYCNGFEPERYAEKRPVVKPVRFEHSIGTVLKRAEKPRRAAAGGAKNEIVNISIEKPALSGEQYFEKEIDRGTIEKFEKFFSSGAERGTKKRKRSVSKAPNKSSAAMEQDPPGVFSFFSNYKNAKDLPGIAKVKPALSFALAGAAAVAVLSTAVFVSYGLQIKDDVRVKGQQALSFLSQAQEALQAQNFASARANFQSARQEFESAESQLNMLGGDMLDIFSKLPFLSRISSGKNLASAGNELALAGEEMAEVVALFSSLDNPFEEGRSREWSMIDLFFTANEHITEARSQLESANGDIQKVKSDDLPAEYRDKFSKVKEGLPLAMAMIDKFENNSKVFLELLGHNGPRKYLFLFQNNQEMRATGGFIGSYGLLSINDGQIKNLVIDGIFNPDGQLTENVVPPRPIQKISAGWSTHDANWYPHFPSSAHKIAWFYEKTGGPTVDGIITFTPTVMKKMLELTGEISMPEYGASVNADNFVERTQFEVEIDFDKELNQPKKFIADLAPKVLDKLFSLRDPQDVSRAVAIMNEALKEKHVLIYSFNDDVQKIVSGQGWTGEILGTEKDYLMVVNSNINGFKTDGVIDEKISHRAEIKRDGSIIDTVKIVRAHNGGDSDFDWWNKVNSDYLRVYVPKGSQLITARGHTRELVEPPLDYAKLKFKIHEDVLEQEQSMKIDEETGTRIYEEEGKTVFANWVYVSPKETVEVEYQYLLPFKIDLGKNSEGVDTFSLLAQKQSGSEGSKFESLIAYEADMTAIWKYPETVEVSNKEIKFSKDLKTDQLIGIVFQNLANASKY